MKARNRSIAAEMEECLQGMQGSEYDAIPKDETKQIIALFQAGDRSAGDRLIKSNVILFKSYVLKWKSKYKIVSIDDLFQVVRYGIHEAARVYQESKSNNASFKTHCHFYVWKHFRIYMRERSIIKVGNNPDSDKTISDGKKQEIHECAKVARSRISMNMVDIISIDQVDDIRSEFTKEKVKKCLETLNDRQKFIISNLFGLDGIPVLTIKEIQEILGIKKTVYKHKNKAIKKIKEAHAELAS